MGVLNVTAAGKRKLCSLDLSLGDSNLKLFKL